MEFPEFSNGVRYLAIVNPDFKRNYDFENKALLMTWFNALKSYSAKQFKAGIDAMTAGSSDYPKLAILLDYVRRQRELETNEKLAEEHRVKMLEAFPVKGVLPSEARPLPEFTGQNPLDEPMKRMFQMLLEREDGERSALRDRLHVV